MTRRTQLIENLKHKSRYRLNIELSKEARDVLVKVLEEDPSVSSLTTLINKIIVEWDTLRKEKVKTDELRKEVETLTKMLRKINKWIDTIDKRLIRMTARTGIMLMRQGEKP